MNDGERCGDVNVWMRMAGVTQERRTHGTHGAQGAQGTQEYTCRR